MTLPFEAFQNNDTPAEPTSAYKACCAEVWGPPAPEKPDAKPEARPDKADTPAPIEPKDLLKPAGSAVPPHEAAHLKTLTPNEIDQVRKTFDSLGLEKTKVSPENISNVSRNLVEALGSDDYEKREYATKALKSMGIAALPALVDSKLTSTDLEQSRRVDRLMAPFSGGSGQDVAREQLRIMKYEQDRKQFGLGANPNGLEPLQEEMQMQKGIATAPDAKISPTLDRFEKVVAGSKVHLLSAKPEKGSPHVDRELVASRATKLKGEIEAVKTMAVDTTARKAQVKLAFAGNLLQQNVSPEKITAASRDMAARMIGEALRDNPKMLGQQKSDYNVRSAIADLRHLNHPAVAKLEEAYKKAGGDPKKLASTTHRFFSDIQQLK